MDTSANNGPANIGQALNQARIRRRLSIDQVSDALHIRRDYLLALEQNRWDDLPGEVYGQGFLKNYARLLDLDSDAVVEQRRRDIGQPLDHPAIPPMESTGRTGLYAHASPRTMTSQPAQRNRRKGAERDAPEYSNPRVLIWILGVLVVLFVGGLLTLRHGHSSPPPTAALASKKTPKTAPAHAKTTGSRSAKHSGTASQHKAVQGVTVSLQSTSQSGTSVFAHYLVTPAPVTVALAFTGNCWVSAAVNGGPATSGMYYSGQHANFSGSQSVSLILGSHAVAVTVGGQNIPLPTSNDVLNLTFQG